MTWSELPGGLDLDDVEARLAAGRNLPTQTYVRPEFHEFELDAVFTDCWQYFTPIHRVSEPGSVATGMVGRTPIVVVRGDDGELRGFVNACRHRGYRVANDGHCARIQCGYHGWIYGLDGSLRRTGKAESDLSIVKDDLGLLPVSVDTFAQGVFVNPTPDAGTLADAFPGIHEVGAEIGIDADPERYTPFTTYRVEQASNWKLWYDNGTECYHCPTVHKDSFGAAYDTTDGELFFSTREGYSSSHFDPAPNADGLVGSGYRSIQFFPGTQFIQQDDIMIMARVIPLGPDRCAFQADYLAERGSDPERVEEWAKLWSQTYDEDGDIVETIQQNLTSGRIDELIYVDEIEDNSRFFHRLIWDRYRAHVA